MTRMYFILSVVGWAWLVLVALFLVFRHFVKRKPVRGFDVVASHADAQTRASGAGGDVA